MTLTLPSARPRASAPTATGLRSEIQLLRAVAVLAVVGNHLWPAALPGGFVGVDVFFVISGYLISSHLLRELDATGRIALLRFWARRARRLLPASLLVLGVSAVATVLVLPRPLWPDVMRELSASALYVQNWALAADARDYFAATGSASPVTHFWSLSLEEQFYLGWPLLALGAYAAGRRLGSARAAVVVAFAGVVAASLAYSVWATAREPAAAYFVTPARVWQLGIGGLLATAPALLRARRPVALAGWAAIAGSLVLLGPDSAVPGWVALVPVLGTAAVIWAGDPLADLPDELRPPAAALLWVGGVSYALYLWHWPPIVLLPYATGAPLDTTDRLLVLGAALLAAGLSTRLLEEPVRRHPWLVAGPARRTFVPAAGAMLALVLACQLVGDRVADRAREAVDDLEHAAATDRCFGARAIAEGCASPHRLRYPDTTLLRPGADPSIRPRWGDDCTQSGNGTALVTCEFGVPREEAVLRVALVGDSHARHWIPALDELATRHRWNVVPMTKTSCPVSAEPVEAGHLPEQAAGCRTWSEAVIRRLTEDAAIDVVVTSAKTGIYTIDGVAGAELHGRLAAGYAEVWRQWRATGKRVVVIGDVPRPRVGDVPPCVAAAASEDDPCTTPVAVAQRPDPMLAAAVAAGDPGIVPVDLDRFFCDAGTCHTVIGGVVAYVDTNHLVGMFARSLAPYLHEQMRPAL